MDLRQYLHAVRTYWWVIAIPAVLGIAAGLYSTTRAVPQYRASVTFFITTTSGGEVRDQALGDEFAQRRVNSYLGLLSTDRLADQVIESSGLDLSPAQVKGMIGASADLETVLITATVTSESRDLALDVADALSTEFVNLVSEVESTGDGTSTVNLELVSGPNVGELPPGRTMTVGLRAALGLFVGVGLALLLELRDSAVRSDEQLTALGVGPVLGMIPFDRRVRDAPLTVQDSSSSVRAEAFRQLRTNLEFIDVERPVRVLVVTSSMGGEGKSATCANLALSLVAANRVSGRSQGVLIIEGDLRRPTMADYFPVDHSVGLTDLIVGRADLNQAVQRWGSHDLWVLPSGHLPPNPSELLASDAMARLLGDLRERFGNIIINTPPLLPVTDAAVLSAHADGVIVVVRAGKTTRHQVTAAIRSLNAVGARFLGTVMNMVPTPRGQGYSSYPKAEPSSSSPAIPRGVDDELVDTSGTRGWGVAPPASDPGAQPRAERPAASVRRRGAARTDVADRARDTAVSDGERDGGDDARGPTDAPDGSRPTRITVTRPSSPPTPHGDR